MVFANGRVDDVAVPLPDLELTFDDDFLRDQGPSFDTIVLAENDKHETMTMIPASSCHLRVNSVLKFVVNFLEGAPVDELTNFLPVVTVFPLFLYDQLVLALAEGGLRRLFAVLLQPVPVDFDSLLVPRPPGSFEEVHVPGGRWKRP